jgi:hypothetical protein
MSKRVVVIGMASINPLGGNCAQTLEGLSTGKSQLVNFLKMESLRLMRLTGLIKG